MSAGLSTGSSYVKPAAQIPSLPGSTAAGIKLQVSKVTWLLPVEVCSKIAASHVGKHHSEATKQKIGAGRSTVAKRKKKAAFAQQKAEGIGAQAEAAR